MNLSVTSRGPNKVEMQQVMFALQKHCAKPRLMRYDDTAEALKMSFVIEFRQTSNLNQARAVLMAFSDQVGHTDVIVALKYEVEQEPRASRVVGFFPCRMTRMSKYVQGIERVYFRN